MVAMAAQPNSQPEQSPDDGRVAVTITGDRMTAELLVTAPVSGGRAITVEDALAKLAEAGVIYGIDPEAVRLAVECAQQLRDPAAPPPPVAVATGRDATTGEDARIDYHPVLTAARGRPKVLPDGTVDLFDLNLVQNISIYTVLAVMVPAQRGEPGMTVTGAEIPGRLGHEVWLKAGTGTKLSADRLTVTATVAGHPTLMYGEITVTNVFRVKGDVGVETGNIEFVGSVVVSGSVLRGFTVKAEGDVEVQGAVDGGSVEAAGSVIVQYGIASGARVVAGGAVKARFIEAAEVRAGTHLWSTDGILQSRVESGGNVEVVGRRGAIIGGSVTAKTSVTARVLGSHLGGSTEISVGVMPEVRQEMVENQKKRSQMEAEFQRTEQTIQYMAAQLRNGWLSPERRVMLAKLVKAREQFFEGLAALKARSQELEQAFRESRTAWVLAKDTCNVGVRIIIGNSNYQPTRPLDRVRFNLTEDLEIVPVSA